MHEPYSGPKVCKVGLLWATWSPKDRGFLGKPPTEFKHAMAPSMLIILILGPTWTPKVCNIMAFGAMFGGFGLFFYILLGSR